MLLESVEIAHSRMVRTPHAGEAGHVGWHLGHVPLGRRAGRARRRGRLVRRGALVGTHCLFWLGEAAQLGFSSALPIIAVAIQAGTRAEEVEIRVRRECTSRVGVDLGQSRNNAMRARPIRRRR
jgi:hypothetical protein